MKLFLLFCSICIFVHCKSLDYSLIIDPKHKTVALPNLKGCEKTKKCFLDLLTSSGFSTDPLPNYGLYLMEMTKLYSSARGLKRYCGTFDAVWQCFRQESDSCRTPTVFAPLFNLTRDDAYRYSTDLDLRKILCDNQQELQDPCLNNLEAIGESVPVGKGAQASCDNVAADFSAVISQADEFGCPDSVISVFCQISAKTKEIETLGACDGKIPKCWTNFHSCDKMRECFDRFYDGIEKAGVKSPLPDYATYASNMKHRFENSDGIDQLCRLQADLHACLIRHANKNCPLNAASFRSMYNMNYEQAYDYSTDFNLRKAQCLNIEGVKKNSCLTDARRLLSLCQPSIPHNLTLGRSCTDLRLAMKCNNFAVRQFCPEEVQKMYCATEGIIYEQEALGFCDGWMPDCEIEETEIAQSTTSILLQSSSRQTKQAEMTTYSTIETTRPDLDFETTTVEKQNSASTASTGSMLSTSSASLRNPFVCVIVLMLIS